jgi:predicted TIM-barrel fold metal-dependent hydrolase
MTELFDVQAGFGGSAPGVREPLSADWLVTQLRRHQIGQAVVRITPDVQDFDICRSNQRLYEQAARFPELLPCPVLAPAACGDLPAEEEQAAEALRHQAPAVVLRPTADRWEPEPWVVGPLLDVLARHRLPVLCPERQLATAVVARWAAAAPDVPLIVTETSYGRDRTMVPLLCRFPNIYLSIGNTFTAHRGIEFYVARVGAHRLLFGTGLPESEPGAAIGQLLFAEVSESDRELIAHGNLQRLRGGIRA